MQDIMNIPYGYCQCGCEEKTKISPKNDKRRGWIKGEPRKYISGHHSRMNNPNWKGGMRYDGDGYKTIRIGSSYYPYHRFMVEQLLGRKLPDHVIVHHFNGNRQENKFSNFIVCEDNSYHMLLHQRMRAYDACGHANWRKCKFCKQYDDPVNLWIPNKPKSAPHHRECDAQYARERRAKCRN